MAAGVRRDVRRWPSAGPGSGGRPMRSWRVSCRREDRSTAFGFQFMLLNIGLGLGGLISATIIDVDEAGHVRVALRPDRPVVPRAVRRGPGHGGRRRPARRRAERGDGGAMRPGGPSGGRGLALTAGPTVLRDRNLLRYGAVALLLLTFGYGCVESGVGLFITDFVAPSREPDRVGPRREHGRHRGHADVRRSRSSRADPGPRCSPAWAWCGPLTWALFSSVAGAPRAGSRSGP